MPEIDWTILVAGVLVALAIVAAWKVVRSTRARGAWGVNLKRPHACPCCSERLAPVRVPDSLRQLVFGGWTCRSCGAAIDKWGAVANRPGR